MEQEQWLDVKGYKGLYKVSSFGQVKMTGRYKRHRNDSYEYISPKILNTFIVCGYLKCKLRSKDGIAKMVSVHRIVAETFIPNPNNLPQVNHKDENKQNNHVDNLEWCTAKYNANYGTGIQRCNKARYKKVAQYDKHGTLVAHFDSMKDAMIKTGVSYSLISSCCNGRINIAKGYVFKFLKF